jgi:hypothetical protein
MEFAMPRFAFALIIVALFTAPAEASTLIHASATAKSAEKGVTVWRGPKAKAAAVAMLAGKSGGADCRMTVVLRAPAGWAPRRLATHGFWSGNPFSAPYGISTSGFFADRVAAGL